MEQFSKRILLSVTGMSPAVVTETLYALVVEKGFIPTEISVITTLQGKNKLLDSLLGIEGGRKKSAGALEEFIQDYGKQYGFDHIHFDESCIHVIQSEDNHLLPDIRTPEENQLAADQIVQIMGELCQDLDTQIHVSIAGGRKTMGFFLGYALSLYGRKQDSLSHILVAEEFENLPSFFYPKPYPYFINDRNGREIDASHGKVMLAEIPWVRLGLGVPSNLLKNQISYSNSVNKAQQILEPLNIIFLKDIEKRRVQFGSNIIRLSQRGYTFLLCLSIAKKQGWEFILYKEEERISQLFIDIYDLITVNSEHLVQRIRQKDPVAQLEQLKTVLAEARNDISSKVKKAFSIGKEGKTPYIPYSEAGHYKLDLSVKQIDFSQLYNELEDILS